MIMNNELIRVEFLIYLETESSYTLRCGQQNGLTGGGRAWWRPRWHGRLGAHPARCIDICRGSIGA